jgi:hypothetical protein
MPFHFLPKFRHKNLSFLINRIFNISIFSLGVSSLTCFAESQLTEFEQAPSNEAEINQTLVKDLIGLVESNTARGKYRAFRDAHGSAVCG